MSTRFLRFAGYSFVLSAILLLGACHKKAVPAPPTPPPPPAQPTATLTVSPTTVQRGQSVQLSWSTKNSTDVSIDSLGAVTPSGTRSLTP